MTDVGGYRVLRTAARGSRCRLLVGHHDGETVVLKIADADDPAFAIEAEALGRAAGEHVVELLDAGVDGDDAVLVLERLGGGTLGDLLDRGGALTAGEAVTLLAPLALTLDRLHGAGVAHGDLSLESVCLSDDGAPTLVGFGRAGLFAPGAPEVVRQGIAEVLADRAALSGLATLVLARVAGARADAVRRVTASLDRWTPGELAAALFDLAVPEPVRLGEGDSTDPRVVGVFEVAAESEPVDDRPAVLPGWLVAFVPDPFRDRLGEAVTRIRDLWRSWTPRRRRLILGAAAGMTTVALALTVLPSGETTAIAEPVATPDVTPDPVAESARLPEDPVAAATMLLEARERCIRDLSVLCLDDVDQAGSAAYDDDRALITAVESGGEVPLGAILPGDPVLVERLGDSALLDLPEGSDPASILMMQTDAGWRIRDYFPAAPSYEGVEE